MIRIFQSKDCVEAVEAKDLTSILIHTCRYGRIS